MTSKKKSSAKEEQHPSVEVPKGYPEEDSEKKSSNKKSRVWLWVLGALLIVVVLVLAITLPLTLGDDSSDDSSSTDDARQESASSLNDTSTSTSTTTGNNGTTTTSSSTLALFDKDVTEGYKDTGLAGFQSDLQLALTLDSERFIEQQIYYDKNSQYNNYGTDAGARPMDDMAEESAAMPPEASSMVQADGAADSDGPTDYGTNNQETDVDEADIIKADANFIYASYGDYILVWDTNGNQVSQTKMPEIELPEGWGQYDEYPKPEVVVQDEDAEAEAADTEGDGDGDNGATGAAEPGSTGTASSSSSTTATTKSMIMPPYYYQPKPNIRSLLLTDSHLIAIVTGYNTVYYDYATMDRTDMPVINDYQASQIRVYAKTSDGNLNFVGKKDVNGYFVDARSIGDNVFLATASSVDIYSNLYTPLQRYNFNKELTEDQYKAQATELATKQLIPNLTTKLTEELGLKEGELPEILKINQWMTAPMEEDSSSSGGGDSSTSSSSRMVIDPSTYDVIQNVATITSFSVTAGANSANANAEAELSVASSVFMAPNSFQTLYGTNDKLVIATHGWSGWMCCGPTESEQTTYLVALEIDQTDASTKFLSVGTLKGHLLNQYALDIVGDELRAATTINHQQWFGPMPFIDDMVMVDPEPVMDVAVEESAPAVDMDARQANQCPPVDDDCMNEDNHAECLALVEDGCPEIVTMESCPLQFACNIVEGSIPTSPPTMESRTENYMIAMKLVGATSGQMEERGRVQVGEPNESIMSVRFFDNIAYVVTFERTDPFYVVDMDGPTVLGELKVPGFSSYLHSMNADNSMLLAVGQNATEDGRTTGVMITVFDATDKANPVAKVSHTFANGQDAYSSSSVEWDYKAFRLVGNKLIMPMDVYWPREWNWQTGEMLPLPEGAEDFQGFVVLNVDETSIEEQFRVNHTRDAEYCYYCQGGYLPTRSFVYSGNLMTVRGNRVVGTDLEDGTPLWTLDLEVTGESKECCDSIMY